jgi:hypothetical protein
LIPLLFFFGCASGGPPPDPCTLLTPADVFAVQGERFADAVKNVQARERVTVAQCFYAMPERANSITLEVTTAPNVPELWEKQFEPSEERERERGESEGEREGNERHVIEVKGIGRDAFWGGNRVSGALYVLAPHAILRISIGGAGNQTTKMEKAKALASKALEKMK